jgi:3-oxoacyl-[acyl-carrier-protein] synthase III
MTSNGVGILGLGSSLPQKVLKNSDLEKMVDTSDEWIVKRTGIKERRILEKDSPAFELGIEAALEAIKDAGITPEDLDLIIVSTETPDYLVPSTSCIIQGKIGAVNAAAFDINAACTGLIYGMTIATQFIASGTYKHILIVGCEGLSRAVDWNDRNTCVLFGDGAGAVVLGKVEEGFGVLSTHIGADGASSHFIKLPCFHMDKDDAEKRGENKRLLWLDGSEVFKFAVKIMAQASLKVLDDCKLSLDDIKYIIPHQANIRIIDGAAKRLGVDNEKVYSNVHKYGNISSASISVALKEVYENGLVKKGDNIILVGFGGGLTWGSALIKWNK